MKMRKIVAVLAAALMLFSILPLSAMAADTNVVFELGANGSASHYDGPSSKTTYSETASGYTLNLTGGTNMYTGARDQKGNGCIKLGSSSKTGGFSFTVPADVTSVIIAVAKYKTNTTKLTVNGTAYTLTKNSNNGEYDNITVDTSSTKTVTLTTVSGGVRAMVNSITYVIPGSSEPEVPDACEHDYVGVQTKAPDCTNAGETTYTCSKCGESYTDVIAALGHSYGEGEQTLAPTCTEAGETTYTCSVCDDVKTEAVKALGHDYVDGACSVCGEAEPAFKTITFDDKGKRTEHSTLIQVWEENGITVTNNKAGSTTNVGDFYNPARFYKTSEIIIEFEGMTSLVIDANGVKSDYQWTSTLDAAELAYAVEDDVYTINFAEPKDSITLIAANQVRANSITVYSAKAEEPPVEHEHVWVDADCTTPKTCAECGATEGEALGHNYVEDIIDATCTKTGTATYECSVCGHSYDEEIPVKPHNYVDGICDACGAVKGYNATITFDADKTQRTEYSTQIQKWENEGLVLINNKASSTNNIGDFSNPARFYKTSEIIIEFEGMTSLVIDANGIGGDYAWTATLDAAELAYMVEDGVYTINFAEPKDSITLTAANQVRANSITAMAAHNHKYANEFDVDCDLCGAVREVNANEIISFGGNSVSENKNGLAFKFEQIVDGMAIIDYCTADYTDAHIGEYKVIKMGVEATNGVSDTNIEVKKLCDDDVNGKAAYAVRIIDIPNDKLDVEITATPYVVIVIDGVETTIYGEAQTNSYNGALANAG